MRKEIDVKKLLRLRKQGFSFREIGEKLGGVSVTTLTCRIKEIGETIPSNTDRQRKNRYTEEKLVKYKLLYLKGFSIARLSRMFPREVGPITLRKIFKERKWLLSRSEWNSRFNVGDNNSCRKHRKFLLETNQVRAHSFSGFRSTVAYISNLIAAQFDIRRKNKALDHRYSLYAAYYNIDNLVIPISVKELCHPSNLEAICPKLNSSKNKNCSVTAKELRKQIKEWNKMNGDPFKHPRYSSFDFDNWDKVIR